VLQRRRLAERLSAKSWHLRDGATVSHWDSASAAWLPSATLDACRDLSLPTRRAAQSRPADRPRRASSPLGLRDLHPHMDRPPARACSSSNGPNHAYR